MTKFDFDNAGDMQFKIKQLQEGIARCDQNIEIFSREIDKQKALKIELEIQLRELKTKLQAEETGNNQ